MQSMDIFVAELILEYLMEADKNTHRARAGQVLTSLGNAVLDENVTVGSLEYHWISRAVLYLEELDLVWVDRANSSRSGKANLILEVRLKQ